MKGIFIILIFFSCAASAQFHVKVTCNPKNNGQTSPQWVNNFVVEYTTDNWKHFAIIKNQQTWYAVNGSEKASFYDVAFFNKVEDAIIYARQFHSLKEVNKYELSEEKKHNKLSILYAKKTITPLKKEAPISSCKEVAVY